MAQNSADVEIEAPQKSRDQRGSNGASETMSRGLEKENKTRLREWENEKNQE